MERVGRSRSNLARVNFHFRRDCFPTHVDGTSNLSLEASSFIIRLATRLIVERELIKTKVEKARKIRSTKISIPWMERSGNSFRGCLPTQPLTLAERQKFCRCVTSNGPFSEQIADGNSRRSSTSSLDFIFFACEPRRRDSSQRSRRSTTFE